MFPYDRTLLAAAQAPSRSIPDVVRTLEAIDLICEDGDGLKWFNWLYLQVTVAVQARVSAGGFDNPAWLAELDVQFARLYFAALEQSLSGERAPACWRVLFENRDRAPIARIQFALAGVNAHINHDLPAAIVATCRATGTAPNHGGILYQDYTGVNTTLDGLVDVAKQSLHLRLLGDVLPPVSHLEDTIAAWNMGAARESAWCNSEHLWKLGPVPILEAGFLDMLDGFTTVIGKALMVPVA